MLQFANQQKIAIGKLEVFVLQKFEPFFSGHRHSRLHFCQGQNGRNPTYNWQNASVRQTSQAATFDGSYQLNFLCGTVAQSILHNSTKCPYVNTSFGTHSKYSQKRAQNITSNSHSTAEFHPKLIDFFKNFSVGIDIPDYVSASGNSEALKPVIARMRKLGKRKWVSLFNSLFSNHTI